MMSISRDVIRRILEKKNVHNETMMSISLYDR
jgi:hypothetical protein